MLQLVDGLRALFGGRPMPAPTAADRAAGIAALEGLAGRVVDAGDAGAVRGLVVDAFSAYAAGVRAGRAQLLEAGSTFGERRALAQAERAGLALLLGQTAAALGLRGSAVPGGYGLSGLFNYVAFAADRPPVWADGSPVELGEVVGKQLVRLQATHPVGGLARAQEASKTRLGKRWWRVLKRNLQLTR